MNIPSSLKIGAIKWQVKEVAPYDIDSDRTVCGDCSQETQTIRINRDMSPEMKEQTLLHEILHAIDLELDHNAVEMLATILHQVIVENSLFQKD